MFEPNTSIGARHCEHQSTSMATRRGPVIRAVIRLKLKRLQHQDWTWKSSITADDACKSTLSTSLDHNWAWLVEQTLPALMYMYELRTLFVSHVVRAALN